MIDIITDMNWTQMLDFKTIKKVHVTIQTFSNISSIILSIYTCIFLFFIITKLKECYQKYL